MKYLHDLIYWIEERERIRLHRENRDPKPWSRDTILNQYRFCNVHREDDTVTKWIRYNWVLPNYDSPTLPFAMCVARMVNYTGTLRDLGYPHEWNPKHFIATLEARKIVGLKNWTSAYMITGGYSPGGEPKEVIIARVLDAAYKHLQDSPIVKGDTLEVAASKIKTPGIGTFLTAQIIADLKHTPFLVDATDWLTWCAPGPGSTMGLNFLHEREPKKAIPQSQFIIEVNELREIVDEQINVFLDAQNMQNCLCEFHKYVRAKYLGHRLKSKYIPGAND